MMFKEKNFGNSVDDGAKDNGGMWRKAFLDQEKHTNKALRIQELKRNKNLNDLIIADVCLTVCSEEQSGPVQGLSPWMR